MALTCIKISIPYGEKAAIGMGKAALLEAIQRTGSISAAGREMGIPYRRAWELVETMNRCFAQPIVTRAVGGRHGGGSQLTSFGMEVLRRYREIEAKANESVIADIKALSAMLRPLE